MKARTARGAFRRLLGNFWFGVGALAVPAAAEPEPARQVEDDGDEVLAEMLALASDTPDPAVGGHRLALVLDELDPFDATRIAAIAASSPRAEVRLALAEALTWEFRLVGDDVILDHLSRDADTSIRFAVARAAHTRRAALDDEILLRLSVDKESIVANTAAFAIGTNRS